MVVVWVVMVQTVMKVGSGEDVGMGSSVMVEVVMRGAVVGAMDEIIVVVVVDVV